MKRFAVGLAACLVAGAAWAQEAPRHPLALKDRSLTGVVGYVGPKVDWKTLAKNGWWPEELRSERFWGTAGLSVCVNESGAATSVDIQQSSGNPRLDALALEWAKAASYRAAEMNGKKLAVCGYLFSIDFVPPPPKPSPGPEAAH